MSTANNDWPADDTPEYRGENHVVPSAAELARMLTEAQQPDLPEWLRELYPFRTRALQLGQYRMSLVDEAPAPAAPEKPVFVLLHGNHTWSFLYRDLIARLRQKYRVIAPDMIGFGLSDKPEAPGYHTLQQHLSNFNRLIEALQVRDLVLVVSGWGGPVGLEYAGANPQNVERLVLVNTWAGELPRTKPSKRPLGVRIAEWGAAGRWLDSWLNLSMHSVLSSHSRRPLRDLALEAYSYPYHQRASRVAISQFSRMFFDPDQPTIARMNQIEAGLKNIAAPADILCGARDPILSKLPAYLLRDALKNARNPIFLDDNLRPLQKSSNLPF